MFLPPSNQTRSAFIADIFGICVTLIATILLIYPFGTLGAALALLSGAFTSAVARNIVLARNLADDTADSGMATHSALCPKVARSSGTVSRALNGTTRVSTKDANDVNIRNVTFDQLTDAEVAAWSAIQRNNVAFASPYFCPEFTQHVAAVRAGVEVAVLEKGGVPVGFFPFQRRSFNAGHPIGRGVCDFEALIAPPDIECDPLELLRACGLSSWRFDHLVPVHSSFQRFTWSSADAHYIDLSDGFDAYIARRPNGGSLMKRCRQKRRNLERLVGPIRFERHVSDRAVLETCIQWKVEQYRRKGIVNIFNYPWIAKLLHSILPCQGEDFASAMPVCYAGDQIAAINFGMRYGDVFHSWFTAYNPDLASFSPGMLHWIEIMKAAESLGIRRISLGTGEEPYKSRLTSGADRVMQGCVDSHPAVFTARRTWRQTRQFIKASPLRAAARVPARIVHRIATWMTLR